MSDIREETFLETGEAAPVRTGRFVRSTQPAAAVPVPAGRTPRPRHEVPRAVQPLLRPFFRYSYSRDAWVLLGIGSKRGPVIRDL